MDKSQKNKEQEVRAWWIFIILVAVFIICIFFILAIQYHWWGWFINRNDAQYDSADPLTWVLASLIGATLYLMGQIATYFPKIGEKRDADNQNDFIRSTYWYAATLIRAPILTVVVMWLLINLSVGIGNSTLKETVAVNDNTPVAAATASGNAPVATATASGNAPVATATASGNTAADENTNNGQNDTANGAATDFGVSVNFANFPDIVNLGIAFILGFYSRVARKQLDILAKYLFTRAWALAEMGYEISASSPDTILLGEAYTFKTEPKMDVVWTANIGNVGAESGIYTAPEKAENYNNNVVVLAYLRSEPTSTQAKQFTLKLFRITGNPEIAAGKSATLKLEKKLEKLGDAAIDLTKASWTCDVPGVITDSDANGEKVGESISFTAPAEARDLVFTAKYETYDARFSVTVTK